MPKMVLRDGLYSFDCPVCRKHYVPADRWKLIGDMDNPTLAPSVKETVNPKDHAHYQARLPTTICHFHVRNGTLEFCSDCTHALAGQTVPMTELTNG